MSLHLLWLIPCYMGLAALREAMAVFYYRAISERRATLASGLSMLIEWLDCFVLVVIVVRYMQDREILLPVFYAIGGAIGVFYSTRRRKK